MKRTFPRPHQLKYSRIIIIACIVVSLFFVLGIAVRVWGLQGLVALISGDQTVITNGAGDASITINCSTDNFQEHSGYCDGEWVGGIEEDCEGDWVPEQQNCCLGGAGWVDPWTEYASITKCATDFGCSCAGGQTCQDDTCIKTFDAGIFEPAYQVTVNAEDSLGYQDSDSYDIYVDTRVFKVTSIESEDGIMDPRLSHLTINTSLPIGSDSVTGNIIFTPADAAKVESCSIGTSKIICNLIKQGQVYGHDVYWNPEYSGMTVHIPGGLVISSDTTHNKSLLGSDQVMEIGCVLRKVTPEAQTAAPADDIVVGPEDLWGTCDQAIGQQRRTVKLRNLDCSLDQVEEMRGCQETPRITSKIIRTDYSDLSAIITQEDKDSGRASFGPLSSVLVIKGDYFYPVRDTVCASADWASRTFTEVWIGKDPAVKIAGIGCFSRAPYLSLPNSENVAFINEPVCQSGLTDCVMQVQIRQEVPECADRVEVKAVVQPKIYQVDTMDPLKWDDGNQPWGENKRQEEKGDEAFTIVPSSFDGGEFIGARFSFNWADQEVGSKVIGYLTSIGAKQNQGVVGLPLSLSLEDIYESGPMPRHCAVPNADLAVCTESQVQDGECLCGFGRKNYQDEPTQDFIKIKFYNGADLDPAESKKILRPEKDVSLWEVGKPWNKFKIFPTVPFLDEEAKPGIVRAYVCGNDIGFIESKEDFELLSQDISYIFAISKVSPFWGSAEIDPLVWGYNLLAPVPRITATIDTWQGRQDILFSPIESTYGSLTLLSDDLHPPGTALGDLEFCRDTFCVKLHQDIYKEKYNPAGDGRAPRIDAVSSLENWQAKPFPVVEDIPYVENFCIGDLITINGSDFGEDQGQVLFWREGGWSDPDQISIESWSDEEIQVKVQSDFIGKSADCAGPPHQLADVSNLRLPAKICDADGNCSILDQDKIKIIPPHRVRLVDQDSIVKDNYCLNDRILIYGSDFGDQRLGATISVAGEEVSRYINWSDNEIIVTPPAIYSGRRSPFCPRTDLRNKDGLLTIVKKSDPLIIHCPDLPAGPRQCQIDEIKLVDPYIFQSLPVYQYQDNFKYFSNICIDDKVEFAGVGFGDQQESSKVEFWSNKNGWDQALRYLSWSDTKVVVMPPSKSAGQNSSDCPRYAPGGDKEPGTVSIFKGPIRVCVLGVCQYSGLNSTSVNTKIKIYKHILTNKQYLANEQVRITGKFFSDIRSLDEFRKSSASENDKRNTAYVEFYTDEIGWVPAQFNLDKGDLWTDTFVQVRAPKISLEDRYGGPDAGVSVAKQPIRICTQEGCSTNLVNYQEPEIVEAVEDGGCIILNGFNFGDPEELGIGYGAYKTGNWWKQADFPIWSDNAVKACFNGDTAEILRLCRADEKCLYWDLGAKQEIAWRYPEIFAVSPICLPAKKAVDAMAQTAGIPPKEVKILLTVYGKDLDENVIDVSGHYVELSDGSKLDGIEIYDDSDEQNPEKNFKQQYYDKLVLRVPSFRVQVPDPTDPKARDTQVMTGKLFLKSRFAHKNKIEVSNSITFSDYCMAEVSCINAPMIAETNNQSYVGEDKDKAVSLALSSDAIINGCNLGSGEGSSIVFGDVYQFNDLAARLNWNTESISISAPFGAKSGFLAISDIWTGLQNYSAVWLDQTAREDPNLYPRTNLLFNILPTIGELGTNLGASGQILEIYGSDFCGPIGCADFVKDVYLGVWQQQTSAFLDLKGAPGQIFDVSPRRLRVKITEEDNLKTYGDIQANLDKMAASGQIKIKRGDDTESEPIIKTNDFDPEEFLDNPLYFTKAPILREVLPNKIYERDIIYFKGADYYGPEVISDQLIYKSELFNSVIADEAKQSNVEFALSEPYNLQGVDIYERDLRYPDLLDLKSKAYKRPPDWLWQWSEIDRRPYFSNPQSVILSNWDGTFSAWLEAIYKDPSIRPVYRVLEAKEVQCMVREPLAMPAELDLPPPLPEDAEPLEIHKIVPLPLLDVCYFCQNQDVSIFAKDQTSFGDLAGTVSFWSDAGWVTTEINSWTNTEVSVRLGKAQAVKHNQCSGDKYLSQGRLPLKLCRDVDAGAPEQCVLWYGPKTHIKIKFAAGRVSQSHKRTLGRFNRLNLAPSQVFAGDNLIEKVFIDDDYGSDYGTVELFINKLYNDIKADDILEDLYVNIFSPFAAGVDFVSAQKNTGLIWIDEIADLYQKNKFNYSTNLYNTSFRYLVCFDDDCEDKTLVYPEFVPAIGGFYQGREIKQVKLFSYGLVSDAVVELGQGARP